MIKFNLTDLKPNLGDAYLYSCDVIHFCVCHLSMETKYTGHLSSTCYISIEGRYIILYCNLTS